MKKVVSILILLVALSGCSTERELNPQMYVRFMEDNHNSFRKVVKAGAMEYTIQLATPEYMVSRQYADTWQKMPASQFTQRLEELKGHIFFLINITAQKQASVVKDMEQKADAGRMVTYFQSAAASDITLTENGTELRPVTYVFENNYGLAPYNTILVGFEHTDTATNLKLVFNDRYYSNPLITTNFSKEDFSKLPALDLK